MKRFSSVVCLLGSLCLPVAQAAEYALDFSGATPLAAEAPVTRRAEMAVAVGQVPSVAVGDSLTLKLFEDVDFALKIVSAPPAGIAGQNFIARDENGPASAIVKVTDKTARISVDDFMNQRQYTVRCKDGKVLIVERDNSQVEAGECGTCAGEIEAPQPVEEETKTASTKSLLKARKLLTSSSDTFPLADQKSVVDILVAFDKGAKAWALSESNGYNWENIQECADAAIQRMNDVLINSKLDNSIQFRLVGVTEVDDTYSEIGEEIRANIRLGANALKKIPSLRDYYGADIVTLLIDVDENADSDTITTGIADGLRATGSGTSFAYNYDNYNMNNYGYNICHIRRTFTEYTMAHETGHCMGAGHSNKNDGFKSPQSATYSCGYHFIAETDKQRYRTVMGYKSAAGNTWSAVPYFSSPDLTPDKYGITIGTAESNDNCRVLRETRDGVTAYRKNYMPYDWDVKFQDDAGNDIRSGTYFPSYHYVTLTHSNPNATIYYTVDGSTPTSNSSSCAPGYKLYVSGAKTITACAVIDGVAQSMRTIEFKEGLTWSGDDNGNGLWINSDSSVRPWTGEYFYKGDAVVFPDLADITNATVTVKGAIETGSTAFNACTTHYTFEKGDDDAQITIPDSNFAPVGDLTFNVPVKLDAATFTNMFGRSLTFNAPFGQEITATTGYCSNMIGVAPNATLTVAPGKGKTQTFEKLNNEGWYSYTSTFRVGEGTVVFKGDINGGAGVIGRTKLEVGNGGNLVFNMESGTGMSMNQTSLKIEKGGSVTFNNMEIMRRDIMLGGGNVTCKGRWDLMSGLSFTVTDDSTIEGVGSAFLQFRSADAVINVADTKTLTCNIPTGTYNSDSTGRSMIKRGGGTMVVNKELKHSGKTDIKSGSLVVGYSSGSSYGTGWSVARGATLKIKQGCSLSVPSLAMSSGAKLVLPAASSAPLSISSSANLTGIQLTLEGASDLSLGATYPIISANGGIVGVRSIHKNNMPALGQGLSWKLDVVDNVLKASVVNENDADVEVNFITNNNSMQVNIPDDVETSENGCTVMNASPIVIDSFDTKAMAVTLDIIVPETSPSSEATLCSWNVGTNIIRCVRKTDGTIDCFHAASSHVSNTVDSVSLSPGKHTLKIGYYSESTYGGTWVYLDDTPAYVASGLKWSSDSVTNIAIGATVDTVPAYPYPELEILNVFVIDAMSGSALPGMSVSGGTVSYNYVASRSPRVFGLLPAGGFELNEALLSAVLSESYSTASVSVVASFPDNAVGTICGMHVYLNALCAVQAEYDGNGSFIIRFDGYENTYKYTVEAKSSNVSSPHLYTLTYSRDRGVVLFQDGVELLVASAPYTTYTESVVSSLITFGCGPWHKWGSRWGDQNSNPMPYFKVYASHIALGTDSIADSIDPVMTSLSFDEAYDGMSIAEKLSYLPTYQTATGVAAPVSGLPTVDVLVAYDNGAQAYVANKSQTLEAFAQTQIDKMNEVLVTNRLDRYYSYRLAGVCKVDGVYNDIDTAPGLIAAGEGPAVSLRAARELYGADTVTLLVDVTGNTLGNSSPLNSPNDVASQHECAFSVCSIRAVDTGKQHTMIHENAHNMGCGHARAQSIINSPFEYGRGYYFTDGDVTRHTIMAYGGDNDASWYFSTTSKEFGFELGDATNNNARVLKETCGEVAKWREGAAIALAGVDVQDVAFATSALYPWSVEGDAIRSFNQTNYQYQCTTPLRATITGPKVLSFKHKSYFGGESVAGNNYSHFDVLLDDSPVLTQTECTNSWTDAFVVIPDGTHEVTFVFSQRFAMNNSGDYKDGTPAADDAVWLKDIALEEVALDPILNIPAGARVNLADVPEYVTTITGEGTLVCGNTLPDVKYGFTNGLWKGKVAFENLVADKSTQNFQFELYGNANSRILLTNCTINYLKNNNATFAGTLELAGNGTAFSTVNGYSGYYNVFGALEGSGSMSFTTGERQAYVFNTASNYTGSITLGAADNSDAMIGKMVVIGDVASASDLPGSNESASVFVKSGAIASIGADAKWTTYNGVAVGGTLLVKGAAAELKATATTPALGIRFDDGASMVFCASNAFVECSTKLFATNGTVEVSFADGVTPLTDKAILSWPNASEVSCRFKLVGSLTNDYEVVTNATRLMFQAKPTERIDLSGYSYITYQDIDIDWLEEGGLTYIGDEPSWDEVCDFMYDTAPNGYTHLQNFLLGFAADEDKKFQAKISCDKDGHVVIETTEEKMPTSLGIVKRLFKKSSLDAPWDPPEGEVMNEKTKTLDATGSGFYRVEVSIEAE